MFLTVEMTEAELFALDMIALNKQDWADNVLTDRARVAMEQLKSTPEWAQAIAAHIKANGDPNDDWGVLIAGRNAGLFKTAAERQAEAEQPTTPVDPDAAAVDAEAMRRKIVLFNSLASDGVVISTAAEYEARKDHFNAIGPMLLRRESKGQATEGDIDTLNRIEAGLMGIMAIDAVASYLKSLDPIPDPTNDEYWNPEAMAQAAEAMRGV